MNNSKKAKPEPPRGGLFTPHKTKDRPLELANEVNLKVCDRVHQLKLYAAVMMALGILILISAISALTFLARRSPHLQNSSITVLGVLIVLFVTIPTLTLASILLLSRSTRLVKAILRAVLVFYLLSVISSLLTLFRTHNANTLVGFIPLLLDSCLAYWTYGVFSEVNSLTD